MSKKYICTLCLVLSLVICLMPCTVSSSAAGKVALSKKKITLVKGKSCKIKLKNAISDKIKWNSRNKKIAVVKKGLIKAKKAGRCSVIANYKGKKYVCNVRVKDSGEATVTPTPNPNTPMESGSPSVVSQTNDPSHPDVVASSTPSAPSQTNNPTYPDVETSSDEVKMEVDRFDQDSKVITFTITNISEKTIILPTYFILEKYEGERWVPVPRNTNIVRADAGLIMPGDKLVWEESLSRNYSDLGAGKYRVCVQTFTCGRISAEFMIG